MYICIYSIFINMNIYKCIYVICVDISVKIPRVWKMTYTI